MPLKVRRFSVSVTPELDRKLDELKQARYWNVPQSVMIRDLISLGLLLFEAVPDPEEPEEKEETDSSETSEA